MRQNICPTAVDTALADLRKFHTALVDLCSVERTNPDGRKRSARIIQEVRSRAMQLGMHPLPHMKVVHLAPDDPCNACQYGRSPVPSLTFLRLTRRGKTDRHTIIERDSSSSDRVKGVLYTIARILGAGKLPQDSGRYDICFIQMDMVDVTIPTMTTEHAYGDYVRMLALSAPKYLEGRHLIFQHRRLEGNQSIIRYKITPPDRDYEPEDSNVMTADFTYNPNRDGHPLPGDSDFETIEDWKPGNGDYEGWLTGGFDSENH